MVNRKLTEKKVSVVDLFPYIFIVAVVPLIVHLYINKLDPVEAANWTGGDEYADLFSYWKSRWFIIASAIGLSLFIIRSITGRVQLKPDHSLYIPAAVYTLFIILSTVNSKYISVALSGFVARHEGLFVLLFYVLNMLVIFNLVNNEKHVKIICNSLLISAAVISLLGLLQFTGHDFFKTGLGKSLILPSEFAVSELEFQFGNMVYGTLSNPNYMGSYVALVFPIAMASIFVVKKKGLKIASGVLSVLLLVNLAGSRSSAGLVGLGTGIILLVICFRKHIFRNKIIIAVSMAIVLVAISFIAYKVLSDIDTGTPEYYLEDIVLGDNTAKIVSSTETLVIRFDDPNLTFHDESGNKLEIDISKKDERTVVAFKDAAYKNYTVEILGDYIKVKNTGVEFYLRIKPDSMVLVGPGGKETENIAKPSALNVRGFEKAGSARIYIWSRTVPLLKDTVFLGSGPDTFAIVFPQYDYIGKINAYGTSNIIVDKPHNIYLQIAVNTGILSLLAFIAIIIVYIVTGSKAYIIGKSSNTATYGAAIFIGICSYLVTGLFNDSVLGVSPIFWVLLGTGFACNKEITAEKNGL